MATGDEQPSPVSSVRKRTSDRRRQLIALSTRGISEQGYDRFSVNELATAAGLSIGGIYRYISTKSDLLVMACEDIYGGLFERLQEAVLAAEGSEQQLRSAFAIYLAACEAAKEQVILLYREYRHLPREAQQRYKDRETRIAALFAEIILAGQRAGQFATADAVTVAQDVILLGHLPALKGWALGERIGARLAQEQIDFLIAGLTCDPTDRAQRPGDRKRGVQDRNTSEGETP